jgi:outer membrane protein TolC
VAETQVMQQETILKSALSRNGVASPSVAAARIVPTDKLGMPDFDRTPDVKELSEMALKLRPEMEQSQVNIRSTEIQLAGSKSGLLPSLDVQASFQNNGLAGEINKEPLPGGIVIPRNPDPYFIGGWPTAMAQVLRRNFPDYSVGVQLSVPIRNRVAQADYVRDQLSLRQQQLRYQALQNDIRVNVQNAVIGLQQAKAAHDAAAKQRVLQEQSLDAEQKKYALGASTIFFVIQSQRDLAQARFSEVQALSTYARAKVELNRVTGQILDANNISINEALKGQISRQSTLPPGS